MKTFTKCAIALGGLVIGIASASAMDDPIKQRQKLMKEGVLPNLKVGVAMVKGETAFDAAKAATAMQAMANVPDQFIKQFPAGSDKGAYTEALPKVWEDMAGFKAANDTFKADALAAADAAKNGEDAFKVAFGKLTQNCGGCHKVYRLPKEQRKKR